MAENSHKLDPQTIARLRTMELKAREVAEGVLVGIHHTPHRGSSIEFAEHKEYTPGDEIKLIDWKAYAKSDRYYVKQFEDDTNIKCMIMLDGSGSMAYKGTQDVQMSKLEYASLAASSMAHLLLNQSDAVGMGVMGQGLRDFLPARAKMNHLQEILRIMVNTKPQKGTDLAQSINELVERISGRYLIAFFSDLLDEPEPLIRALKLLRHRHHEIVVFHIMDPDELEFPFSRLTMFEGMEEPVRLLADARAMRDEYLRQIGLYLDEIKQVCISNQIDYWMMDTRTPLVKALTGYLALRNSRSTGRGRSRR